MGSRMTIEKGISMRGVIALALLLTQCLLLGTVSAQSFNEAVEESRSPFTGRVHHVAGVDGNPLPLPEGVEPDLSDVYQVLRVHGDRLGIRFPERELELVRSDRCSLGQIHHTFQQVYLGVKVFSGVIKVHLESDGTPLVINGDFYRLPKKLAVKPSLTVEDAVAFAEAALEQNDLVQTTDAELVIANPGWWGDQPLEQPVLTQHLVLEGAEMLAEHVLIDAFGGELVDRWPAVHSALFREVYDGSGGGLPGTLARAEGAGPTGDADVDGAYDSSGDLYQLLFEGLGRDSLDGNGSALTTTVHWNDGICPNAIWNGNQGAFCDGLATDDVVAHELVHGLTQFTADLIYQNQSGQLNEGYSDIFGEVIDLWNGDASVAGPPGGTPSWPGGSTGGGLDTPNSARTGCNDGSARWRMGEETSLGAIRDMWFPECFNDPPSTTDPLYNQNACGPFDNGGVHTGSGVWNHSFAMLVDGKVFNGQTISPIGMTKAGAVYFRALTVYMTAATNFPQAETLMNQAAADLVNTSPNDPRTGNPGDVFTQSDADQVAAAMIAVGMSEPVCGQAPPGPPPSNDDCAGSIPVFVGLNDIDSNNATTGGPPGDDSQCPGTFLGDVGNDIWYSYVPPEDGLLTVSTCDLANWDTDLLVYSGNCGGGLTQLACNGDTGGCSTFTSTVEDVPVSGGVTYQIRIASWSAGTTGTGQLDVNFVPGGGGAVENCTNGVDDDGDGLVDCEDPECAGNPACVPAAPGDECTTAEVAVLGVNAFDSSSATTGNDPLPDPATCIEGLGSLIGDIWYNFVPDESGTLLATTCQLGSFDSDLVMYTGSCDSLIQVACSGDVNQLPSSVCQQYWSEFLVDVVAGQTYWFRIGAWGQPHPGNGDPGPGALTLDLIPAGPVEDCSNGVDDDGDGLVDCEDPSCASDPNCVVAAPGDECSSAAVAIIGVNPIDTTSATQSADPYDDAQCTGTFLGQMINDVWYEFTAPVTGDYTISTCDTIDFDSDIVVYTGTCGALTQVACNGDGPGCAGFSSLVETQLNGGDVYYIRVGGWNGAAIGTGNVEIESAAPPPPPEQCANGTDDDGDGLADCEDPDCVADPNCVCEPTSSLSCVQGSGNNVVLSWANGEAYSSITIFRNGVIVASIAGTSTSHTDGSVPLGSHAYVIQGNCNPGQQAPGSTCLVEVVQNAGFTFTALDVSTGYSATGASFVTDVVGQELSSNPGFPTSTAGFSIGLGHDSALLEGMGAFTAGPVSDLDGGNGPSFFDSASYPDGMAAGCVFSFTSGETIQMISETPLVTFSYQTLPGVLVGETGTVTSTLQFVDTLGSPPVQNVVATDTGVAIGVAGQSGTVTLEPSGFILTAVDQTVTFPEATGASSFTASVTLEEDPDAPGYPNDTQGFSFGVSHDPSILTVTDGAGGAVITDFMGGIGPDYFDANLLADGITFGCVYCFVCTGTIQFATATELATIEYDTVPGALAGSTADVTTSLSITDSLGIPPVELVVVVGSGSVGVLGVDGTITLTPTVGGFVRADVNDDGAINLADAITLLEILFLGGALQCQDAADTNDDEQANIADAIYLLSYLFTGGDAPPPPFGGTCGADPAGTALDCAEYNSCD